MNAPPAFRGPWAAAQTPAHSQSASRLRSLARSSAQRKPHSGRPENPPCGCHHCLHPSTLSGPQLCSSELSTYTWKPGDWLGTGRDTARHWRSGPGGGQGTDHKAHSCAGLRLRAVADHAPLAVAAVRMAADDQTAVPLPEDVSSCLRVGKKKQRARAGVVPSPAPLPGRQGLDVSGGRGEQRVTPLPGC